jgi:hypothetical protein
LTLTVELLFVWMLFLPRRFRIVCFLIVTFLQIGIILTANYAFLNYLVLSLGILLLDDSFLLKFVPGSRASAVRANLQQTPPPAQKVEILELHLHDNAPAETDSGESLRTQVSNLSSISSWSSRARALSSAANLWLAAFFLAWILYANIFLILEQVFRGVPLPASPVAVLEPFRVADQYGLFGRMTWKRYEIEFQGSNDGSHWTAYLFRNKPQNPAEVPRIYAPYQPRFDWNLWFASLGYWRENPWIVRAEQLLLSNDRDVLSLFEGDPFPNGPPKQVRAVLWQYWFTDLTTKRASGMWWRREYLGLYAPALERTPDGSFFVTAWPESQPPPP